MLTITSCILLAASALGDRQAPYSGIHTFNTPQNYAPTGAVYPIDYNDELTITNPMVKPGDNIIFSFEQIRSDQPSIVDAREENIAKYMYRHHKTTTTPPTSTAALSKWYSQEESNEYVPHPQRYPTHPVMLATGTTEKPQTLSFHDFSGPLQIPDSNHIDSKARYPDVSKWSQVVRNDLPPSPPTPKWGELYDLEAQSRLQPSHYTWSDSQSRRETAQSGEESQRTYHISRGNHRHMSGDAMSAQAPTLSPLPNKELATTPAASKRGPPPAAPTLSPWEGDHFGK